MSSNNTETRDLRAMDANTENIYETVAIIAKRSNQIGVKIKEELNAKLSEFAPASDNLEEVFENREQIEISKHYERMPKPTLQAIEEFNTGKTYFRTPVKDKLLK
jgi:DNA-directed RNA polymerase subunit K/omega